VSRVRRVVAELHDADDERNSSYGE
jgi:hypothetical protein